MAGLKAFVIATRENLIARFIAREKLLSTYLLFGFFFTIADSFDNFSAFTTISWVLLKKIKPNCGNPLNTTNREKSLVLFCYTSLLASMVCTVYYSTTS